MLRCFRSSLLSLFVCLLTITSSFSQTNSSTTTQGQQRPTRQSHGPVIRLPRPNLAKEKTLYVVGYAHLDTEWRWEYPQVIQEYLTKTMRNNFMLFDKYPNYIFNFTGANRYRLMKEYYPSDFERLKLY